MLRLRINLSTTPIYITFLSIAVTKLDEFCCDRMTEQKIMFSEPHIHYEEEARRNRKTSFVCHNRMRIIKGGISFSHHASCLESHLGRSTAKPMGKNSCKKGVALGEHSKKFPRYAPKKCSPIGQRPDPPQTVGQLAVVLVLLQHHLLVLVW